MTVYLMKTTIILHRRQMYRMCYYRRGRSQTRNKPSLTEREDSKTVIY